VLGSNPEVRALRVEIAVDCVRWQLRCVPRRRSTHAIQGRLRLRRQASICSYRGTLTAGNSTPLTDGASSVLLASEDWARDHNLPVLAYISFAEIAAIEFVEQKQNLLLAPVFAATKMLKKAGLTLQDFDFYEVHEAFAAQVLAVLKDVPIPAEKLNVNGGAIALGHPIGCTGARMVVTLLHELQRRGKKRGLATLCVSGGMGMAMAIELTS